MSSFVDERPTSRRRFFWTLLVVIALLVLINLFRLGFVSYPEADVKLECFTDKEYAVLKAAADTLLPGAADAPSASALGVPGSIDKFLATAPPELGARFKQLLMMLEHGTTIFGLKFRRFTELSQGERLAYLEKWMNSDLSIQRQGFMGLKKLVATFYYVNPRSWQAIGYPGPWVKQA